jgi:hypothetical protein
MDSRSDHRQTLGGDAHERGRDTFSERSRTTSCVQRGQAAVEFAVFTIILVILLLIPIQLAWIGVQKWQFTHFGNVAARSWSVYTDRAPSTAVATVQARAGFRGWNFSSRLWVFPITASQTNKNYNKAIGGSVNAPTIRVQGLGTVLPIFRPFFGVTGPWGYSGYDAIGPITTRLLIAQAGMVRFEGHIPMAKEPREQANTRRRDNDCRGTPCQRVNGR